MLIIVSQFFMQIYHYSNDFFISNVSSVCVCVYESVNEAPFARPRAHAQIIDHHTGQFPIDCLQQHLKMCAFTMTMNKGHLKPK